MIGPAIGAVYPGLYAVTTHAVITVGPTDDWFVDTSRCVTFTVAGTPWTPPTTWLLLNTVLPPCLTFNPLTGQICGIPMRVGTTLATLRATDASGRTLTFQYTLTVRPKP